MGVGAAALATSAILYGLASSAAEEYRSGPSKGLYYDEAEEHLERADRYQAVSLAMLGVGVAAAATGVVLLVVKGRRRQEAASALLFPDPTVHLCAGGAGLRIRF